MCNNKFSGKPNEMLVGGGGLVMDLDPILGKGGEEEGNVRHSLSLHAKETGISLSQMGHLAEVQTSLSAFLFCITHLVNLDFHTQDLRNFFLIIVLQFRGVQQAGITSR